jgi:molybdopterin biosynthesis enzyme
MDDLRARSTGSQSSAVLRSMSVGDGLILSRRGVTRMEAGARIRVILLRPELGSPESPL